MTAISHSSVVPRFDTPTKPLLGLITLSTDLTTELDMHQLIGADEADIYTARVAFENPITDQSLRQMEPSLTQAASLLLPDIALQAICYSCTLASITIGDAAVTKAIQKAKPGVKVITPSAAACAALADLSVKCVAVLVPYTLQATQGLPEYFTKAGFDIAAIHCLGVADDRDIARMQQQSVKLAARQLIMDSCDSPDGLFISCTGLPIVRHIPELEQALGIPIVSSNLASAWMLRQYAGLAPVKGYGQLLEITATRLPNG